MDGMTADGDYADLAEAVVARLRTAPELGEFELFWFPPAQFDIPAGFLRPDPARDRDYQGTFAGLTRWFMRLELHVDATDDEAAHRELGRLVSKRGPVVARLCDDGARDALWDLCGLNIAPTDGRGWRRSRRNRLQADIGLVLGAN